MALGRRQKHYLYRKHNIIAKGHNYVMPQSHMNKKQHSIKYAYVEIIVSHSVQVHYLTKTIC